MHAYPLPTGMSPCPFSPATDITPVIKIERSATIFTAPPPLPPRPPVSKYNYHNKLLKGSRSKKLKSRLFTFPAKMGMECIPN